MRPAAPPFGRLHPSTPVIVGVASIIDRISPATKELAAKAAKANSAPAWAGLSRSLSEPSALVCRAAEAALDDAVRDCPGGPPAAGERRSGILRAIGHAAIVPPWSWLYEDLAGQVAATLRLGRDHARDVSTVNLSHGGNQSVEALDAACRSIASGRITGAVVAGGDALASIALWKKAGAREAPPTWTPVPKWASSLGFDLGEREEAMQKSAIAAAQSQADGPEETKPDGIAACNQKAAEEMSAGTRHRVGTVPLHGYAMVETRFRVGRAGAGSEPPQIKSLQDSQRESRVLYSNFEQIARSNEDISWLIPPENPAEPSMPRSTDPEPIEPYLAWSDPGRAGRDSSSPAAASAWGRPVALPYHTLECAHNNVNLSAAVVLLSAGEAARIGVPESRWIFPLAGHGAVDQDDFWLRRDLGESASLTASLAEVATQLTELSTRQPADAAGDTVQTTTGLIDPQLIDIYSCFPIVPKLAAVQLGAGAGGPGGYGKDAPIPLTTLGGLTFFGGAGNNYSMHAVYKLVTLLRQKRLAGGGGPADVALALANGGTMTNHHALALSFRPAKTSLASATDGQAASTSPPETTTEPLPFAAPHTPELVTHPAGSVPPLLELAADMPQPARGGGGGNWPGPFVGHLLPALIETYTVLFGKEKKTKTSGGGGSAQAAFVLRVAPPSWAQWTGVDGDGQQQQQQQQQQHHHHPFGALPAGTRVHPPATMPRVLANGSGPATVEAVLRHEEEYSRAVAAARAAGRSGDAAGPEPLIGALGWVGTRRDGDGVKRNVFAFHRTDMMSPSGTGARM